MKQAFPRMIPFLLALGVTLAGLPAARVAGAEEAAPKFEVYGFAHFDYIQDFNRVNPDWAATLRASRIPTTKGLYGSDGQAILSARQSRLGAQAMLPTDKGAVYAKFEFDMFGVGVDAGQTTIRLRHAYGSWNGWLGGQTNSLFMDVDLFPNVADYWGPAGMVFLRNPQLRYTKSMADNSFAIAIEHPSGDIDVGQVREIDPGLGANIVSDNKVPDLTAQFRSNTKWGHFQVAGILRRLGYETLGSSGNNPKGSKTGGGVDLSVNVKTAKKDKLMLGAVLGNGVANYMNDGGMDLAPDGTPSAIKAKAVPLQGYLAYFDHYWNDRMSSSVGYSLTKVDNTSLQTPDAFQKGEYASGNVTCYPTKNVSFVLEGLWGRRTDNGGAKGEDKRIQVSAHYGFSSLDFMK